MNRRNILLLALLAGFVNVVSAQVNLSKGLVAYYPFNGNANDASGNGHNTTINSGSLTSDRYGIANSAYSFAGGNGIVTNSSLSNVGYTGVTLSCWVKTTSTASGMQILNGCPGVVYLNLFSNGHYFGAFDGTGGNNSAANESSTKINSGNWLNLTTKNDGKTTTVYVNGIIEKSYSETQATFTAPFIIASYNAGYSTGYYGNIDDVRVYFRSVSDSEAMAIYEMPKAFFSNNNSFCLGDTLKCVDSSLSNVALTYSWDFGDKATSSLKKPIHVYSQPGTYQVLLKIKTPYGAIDTISKFVYVNGSSKPSFIVNNTSQCFNNNSFNYTNTTSGASSQTNYWDFGDGSTSTSTSISHSYNKAGAYNVKLVFINSFGCSDTVSHGVLVSSSKAAFNLNNTSECFTKNIFKFTNKSTVTAPSTYLWDFGDGTTTDSISPEHSYSKPGSYKVLLTATSNGICTDTISKSLLVYGSSAAFTINNTTQCFTGNSFSFINKTTGAGTINYSWNFGDGNTSTATSPTYSYSSAGSYKVWLYTSASAGCTDSSNINIIVNPKVFASYKVNNKEECINAQDFTFTNGSNVSSGTLNYQWNFGDGSNFSSSVNPTHNYNNAGNYIVRLTAISDKGCRDTISNSISVLDLPTSKANASGATTFCNGGLVILNGSTGPGYNYQWLKDGNKIIPIVKTSTYTAMLSGKYQVVVTSGKGCQDTSSGLIVTVNPLPAKPIITQVGRLLSTTSYTAYQWNLGGNPINGETAISYLPTVNKGDYTVSVYDNNGCSNTSDIYNYDVSGIKENTTHRNNIKLFPNPAHDNLTIDLTDANADFAQLQLVDFNGKVVKNIDISHKFYFQLNIGDIVKGLYCVRLTGKDTSVSQNIVIE